MQGQNQAPQQPPQPVAAPTPLEAIFAQFNNSIQQPAPVVQQPPPPPVPGFDLQAALAGMSTSGQQQQPGYHAPPPPQVNIQAILAQMGTQSAPQVAQMQGYGYGNLGGDNDRKRPFIQDDGDYQQKRARSAGQPGKVPYKVKPCKYWQEGRCHRGDECSYLHE